MSAIIAIRWGILLAIADLQYSPKESFRRNSDSPPAKSLITEQIKPCTTMMTIQNPSHSNREKPIWLGNQMDWKWPP